MLRSGLIIRKEILVPKLSPSRVYEISQIYIKAN